MAARRRRNAVKGGRFAALREMLRAAPVLWTLAGSLIAGCVAFLASLIGAGGGFFAPNVVYLPLLYGIFYFFPLGLTGWNLRFLFRPNDDRRLVRRVTLLTLLLGAIFSCLLLMASVNICWDAEWFAQLYNSEVHAPISPAHRPTVAVLSLVGVAGYLVLSIGPIERKPPLLCVLAIAAIEVGAAECVCWIVQIYPVRDLADLFAFRAVDRIYLCLFPFNCLLLGARAVRDAVRDWQAAAPPVREGRLPGALNRFLAHAVAWPLLGTFLALPLLGICLALLLLSGQAPDAALRAWTQTADWNLSAHVGPPNLFRDDHYLCTVAAGGHPRIVRPLRLGTRRGHTIVVNRQLCIANAFEQLLEERAPRFQRRLRRFYDDHGFPIARRIRTPLAADVVYLLMKPLEWCFLFVLYLCDAHPETRIASQYLFNSDQDKH